VHYSQCAKVTEILHQQPLMYLGGCEGGSTIDNITFASWGTPTGDCNTGGFKVNPKCNAADSVPVVSKACLGKASCSIPVDLTEFGKDPCDGVTKWLGVQVHCQVKV
jgi:hypothetical protein